MKLVRALVAELNRFRSNREVVIEIARLVEDLQPWVDASRNSGKLSNDVHAELSQRIAYAAGTLRKIGSV